MVTLGTARIVNITDKQREFAATTVIPLPNKRIWTDSQIATGSVPITVQNANLAPGDQRCQVHLMPGRFPGTNLPRYARLMFRGEIGAGSPTSGYDYTNYAEKTVTFTDDVTAATTFVTHSAVAAGLGTSSFVFYDPTDNTKTITIPFSQILSLEYDVEGNGPATEQVVRSFLQWGRFFPPDKNTPSFWFNVYLEFQHDLRQVLFWVWIGNSMTGENRTNQFSQRSYRLVKNQSLKLDIVGPTVLVLNDAVKLDQPPSVVGSTTSLTIIDGTKDNNRHMQFPQGCSQVVAGVLLYESGATGMEADTMTAEKSQANINDFIMSQNWGDHDSFGAIGALPIRPTNSLISTDLQGRKQHANQCKAEWDTVSGYGRYPWFSGILYDKPQAPGAGPADCYGVQKFWAAGRSGQPDFRAIRSSTYQEASRPNKFRSPVVPYGPPGITAYAGRRGTVTMTDLHYWHMAPFYHNGRLVPPDGEHLGMSQGNPGSVPFSQPRNHDDWRNYDEQHNQNPLPLYYMLTGDRWAYEELKDFRNGLIAGSFHHIFTRTSPNITGIKAPRGVGRAAWSIANVYATITDAEEGTWDKYKGIKDTLEKWIDSIYLTQWEGGRVGNNPVKVTAVERSRNGWPGIGLIQPWQEAKVVFGFYAIYKATGIQKYLDVAKDLCRVLCLYCTRNNKDSGNKRHFGLGVLIWPYPGAQNYGVPVKEADKFNDSKSWRGGRPFGEWDNVYDGSWDFPLAILGWEWAQQVNDVEWATICKEYIDDQYPGPNNPNIRGTYGWGQNYSNNITEWVAAIENPWKPRILGNIPAVAKIQGQGEFNVPVTNLPDSVQETATITGTSNFKALAIVNPGSDVYVQAYVGYGADGEIQSGKITANETIQGDSTNVPVNASINSTSSITATESVVDDPFTPVSFAFADYKLTTRLRLEILKGKFMTKTDQVFVIWSGDDHTIEYTVFDEDNEPMDLDPITESIFVVRNDVGSTDLINKKLTEGTIVILNQNEDDNKGKLRVLLNSEDTKTMNGKFYVELEITISGVTSTAAVGTAVIQPAALKPA